MKMIVRIFKPCILFLTLMGIGFAPSPILGITESVYSLPNPTEPAVQAFLRSDADPQKARLPFLSWDTEGGNRARTNLLRPDTAVFLRIRIQGTWQESLTLLADYRQDAEGGHYQIHLNSKTILHWDINATANQLTWKFTCQGDGIPPVEDFEIVFPFDPRVTPTTVLPYQWNPDGSLQLPTVISAPDFGQMILSSEPRSHLQGRLQGSRAKKTVDFTVALPNPASEKTIILQFTPLWLPAPKGMKTPSLWRQARRGWFGALQPSAQWGDAGNAFSAPAGILANNVISDPASCSLWFYADQAFWTPQLTPEISTAAGVRRTLDWWLNERTQPNGEVICYWDYRNFLDANAGPLIAAWDYVEATGDREWLREHIEKLELISEYLAQRDIDGDGMVEAVQSGNRGTLKQPARSCAWWDALNCGHKDGYTNALIYRAWRCLSDLEAKIGRNQKQDRYTQLAERLKSTYRTTLFEPKSGWLAWWKSADGERHDYASPIVNGLAIEYGLVDPDTGREILSRLHEKMRTAGFQRFDLGIPPMLVPVHRSDYLLPNAIGIPQREDGTDTFGQYMNGGITAGQSLHFIAAYYAVGERETGDQFLEAMLQRQSQGGFQNGVQDAGGKGIDWTTWEGNPSGYEGYLADSFRFLQAVLLREDALRERYYRPLK